MTKPKVGTIGWIDLTVNDADALRDFYAAVVGLKADGVEMGGYQDYTMTPPGGGDPVAGVCHARGVNAKVPPAWMIYFVVENLDRSLAEAQQRGAKLLDGPRGMGGGSRAAFLQDPAGAAFGLYESG